MTFVPGQNLKDVSGNTWVVLYDTRRGLTAQCAELRLPGHRTLYNITLAFGEDGVCDGVPECNLILKEPTLDDMVVL